VSASHPKPDVVPGARRGNARDALHSDSLHSDSQDVIGALESSDGSSSNALQLAGLILAPATLVTALAFYFGWRFTNARALYFGLDASTLGFSSQDYILRSADALFVPLGAIFMLALVSVKLHQIVGRNLADTRHTGLLRAFAQIGVVFGGMILAIGVFATLKPLPFSTHYLFVPASPGVGMVMLAYGVHMRGRLRVYTQASSVRKLKQSHLDVVLVCLVVLLSVFWTVSIYADAVGRGRAERFAGRLDRRPAVKVYSARRLHLSAVGINEQRLPGRDLAYRYSYSGLRLFIHSDNKYFLLPVGWSPGVGTAIVLTDGPTLRFEFGVGR
jgi:hypothetical protein